MICPAQNTDKCVKDNICQDKFRTNAAQILCLSWTVIQNSLPFIVPVLNLYKIAFSTYFTFWAANTQY